MCKVIPHRINNCAYDVDDYVTLPTYVARFENPLLTFNFSYFGKMFGGNVEDILDEMHVNKTAEVLGLRACRGRH